MLRLAWSGGSVGAASLFASPLGNTACLLLLALLHHTSQPSTGPQPLQATLSTLRDADDVSGQDAEAGLGGVPSVSFSDLYDALCVTSTETPMTMLLYSLVRLSESFREYLLVRLGIVCVLCVFISAACVLCVVCGEQLVTYCMCVHDNNDQLRIAQGSGRCMKRTYAFHTADVIFASVTLSRRLHRFGQTWTPCCCHCWSCCTHRILWKPTTCTFSSS